MTVSSRRFVHVKKMQRSTFQVKIPSDKTTKALHKEIVDCLVKKVPLDEVRILLRRGAQINEPVTQGLRPLHYAVFQGYYDAVQLFVTRGADINVLDDCGYSPLHLASEHGFIDIVTLLLNAGAKVNFHLVQDDKFAKSTQSAEPLRLAIRNKHLHIARMLLEHGANPNQRYFFGAEINLVSDLEYLELLLTFGANPNSRDRSGMTPLMKAVRQPHGIDAALVLIQHGADVNAMADKRHYYRTVLHFAVLSGSYDIINLIIKQGANLNYDAGNDLGKPSPLDLAILRGDPKLVELLIRSGANVNCSSDIIGTPLHVACAVNIANRLEIVQMLLKAGADPNVKLCDGDDHLRPVLVEYLASNTDPNLDVVTLLRKYRARITMKSTFLDLDGTLSSLYKNCASILPQLLQKSDSFDVCMVRRSFEQKLESREPLSLKRQARLFLWTFLDAEKFIEGVKRLRLPKCLEAYIVFDYS